MAARKKNSQDGGGSGHLGLLLVLLVLLVGGLGWNYKRNLELESAKPRPYASYSDAQLAQLRAAYESQVEKLDSRYARASSRRATARDAGMIGEAVEEFQRVQQASRAVRELGAQVSKEQASLDAIREEQALRSTLGRGMMMHVNRAFRF